MRTPPRRGARDIGGEGALYLRFSVWLSCRRLLALRLREADESSRALGRAVQLNRGDGHAVNAGRRRGRGQSRLTAARCAVAPARAAAHISIQPARAAAATAVPADAAAADAAPVAASAVTDAAGRLADERNVSGRGGNRSACVPYVD